MLFLLVLAALAGAVTALLPVGLDARYGAGAFFLSVLAGPVPVRLLPRRRARGKVRPADGRLPGLLRRVPPPVLSIMARCGLAAAKRLRGKVRVRRLGLRFVAGGGDPYRAAMAYARAGLALEGICRACAGRVKDAALRADVDLGGPTVFEGDVRIEVRLGTLLSAAFCFGFAFLREYYRYKTKREG